MSPRRPGGRPRRPWTHCQKRRLVRLYTLTTLINTEILAVLEGEGFNPSERHVQMKLRSLFSKECAEDLRKLRPRSDSIMRSRLNAIQQSRSGRISKTIRCPQVQIQSKTVSSRPRSAAADFENTLRAFRNHYEPITQHLRSHISESTLPDSQPTRSAMLMLDGSTVLKETILVPPEPLPPRRNCPFCEQPARYKFSIEKTLQLSCGDLCHENCLFELLECPLYSVPMTCPNCNAVLALDPTSGIDPKKLRGPKRKRDDVHFTEYNSFPNVPATKRPDELALGVEMSSCSSILPTTEQQKSEKNLGSLSKRLRNRSPSYIEHVYSVIRLSLSDSYRSSTSLEGVASWRSSWMSISSAGSRSSKTESTQLPLQSLEELPRQGLTQSGRRIFYKVTAPLLKGEREIWNEIIDEAQFLPVPDSRPANTHSTLSDRYCPGQLDPFDNSCSHCGYAIGWYHWPPGNVGYNETDPLGNTKLHYAAVSSSATLDLIRSLIDNGVDVRARNSLGETFMHVLKTKQFIQGRNIPEYIALLKFLSNLDFPFFQRDLHGRTVAHLLSKDGWIFCFEGSQFSCSRLLEVLHILNTDMDALDNHGIKVGDEILHSAEKYAKKHNLDTSQDMSKIKELLARYRRPGLLKISFRETLAIRDWTPAIWIRWLQEANLITWIDTHGDTPLIALLKNRRTEDQQSALSEMIPELVKLGVDVNMHDRKGHTALAVAAIRGSKVFVQALLDSGANINSINYHGTGIVSMATLRMRLARREGKTQCYARILSCVNLLNDSGGRKESALPQLHIPRLR